MKVEIRNWCCIERAELDLGRINVFIGRNSSGKSSLAYAIYLAAKCKARDPNILVSGLYGHGFEKVSRFDPESGKNAYPVSIKLGKYELCVKSKGERLEVKAPSESPWPKGYLLPSKRIAFYLMVPETELNPLKVERMGPEGEDAEFLKLALYGSRRRETSLIAVGRAFHENFSLSELARCYPQESRRLQILKPSEFLKAYL